MATSDTGEPRPAEAADADAGKAGTRASRARRWVLELGILVAFWFAITSFQERHLLGLRTAAPSFELAGLNGEHVSLESLRGKRVALHFWATWCGVCAREHGALNALAKGLGPDEAVYAVVADSDDVDKVRDYVKREHIEYPVLLGTPEVVAAYRVDAFPTTYYVDADGRVGGHTVGMATRYSMLARMALLGR